jgi:hypothetical protein
MTGHGPAGPLFGANHGGFRRNRGQAEVTVVLRTGGAYGDIKRVK